LPELAPISLEPLCAAAVEQDAQHAVRAAQQQQRLAGDVDRQEITRIRHLRIVPNVSPCRAPQAFHFEIEQRRAQVNIPMHRIVAH
jgi:hypothetical protein